jgi:CubicO group peptidase (beta-lactamase class C family)
MKNKTSYGLIVAIFIVLTLAGKNYAQFPADDMDARIQHLFEEGNLPSLQVAVIEDRQLAWSKTYGKAEDKIQVYKVGSVRKVIVATSVLQLYDRGLIDLDDDISDYIPWTMRHPGYPEVPVTVEMLLSHRSGLDMFRYQYEWDTRHFDYVKPASAGSEIVLDLSAEAFFKESIDPDGFNYDSAAWTFKPGTNYRYSNTTYLILEFMVEQVTGVPFTDYVLENIFQPLQMDHSFSLESDSLKKYLPAYTRKGELNIELPFWSGIFTTAEDMARFMMVHLNDGTANGVTILNAETLALMHQHHSEKKGLTNSTSTCPWPGYGFMMIYYGNNWYGHGGSTVGYQALWSFNKASGNGYVILTNINGLCHGKENFDSVWHTVEAVETTIKSELEIPNKKKIAVVSTLIMIPLMGMVILFLTRRKKMLNT